MGPRLRALLGAIMALFGVLALNSVSVGSITLLEWSTDAIYQDYFYQLMFLLHLVLGLVIFVPVLVFGTGHACSTWHRPNRNAAHAAIALFYTALVVFVSDLILTGLAANRQSG